MLLFSGGSGGASPGASRAYIVMFSLTVVRLPLLQSNVPVLDGYARTHWPFWRARAGTGRLARPSEAPLGLSLLPVTLVSSATSLLVRLPTTAGSSPRAQRAG